MDVLEAEGVDHVYGLEVYAAIHRASATWDGSDPIRRTDR